MPIVCSAWRRPEAPPEGIDWTENILYGVGRVEDITDTRQLSQVLYLEINDPAEDNELSFQQGNDDDYWYCAVPLEFGLVTFVDRNGFVGGWDGGKWPLDDMNDELGPAVISYNGREYNLYRTDWPGNWSNDYTLDYEND